MKELTNNQRVTVSNHFAYYNGSMFFMLEEWNGKDWDEVFTTEVPKDFNYEYTDTTKGIVIDKILTLYEEQQRIDKLRRIEMVEAIKQQEKINKFKNDFNSSNRQNPKKEKWLY